MRRFTRLALVVLVIPLLAACRLGTPGANTETRLRQRRNGDP